jgi:glycosyltransferase involved in cell wall biosynthesis
MKSPPLKILMVSRFFWDERSRNGGHPGFFGELAQALAAKGIDLTVLSQANDAGLEPEPHPRDGLKIHLFSRERRKLRHAALDKIMKPWAGYRKAATDASIIGRFARKHGPFDAVIAQCEEPDGLACALASRAGGFPPLITQVHDLRYKFREDGVRFVQKSSLCFVFRHSARVVANSLPTATLLHQEYGVPEKKIGQCRIHLTAPFLKRAAENSPNPKPSGQRILFLGALNRKKAPDVFLRAAILLAQDLPNATFALVGSETSQDRVFHTVLRKLLSHPALAHKPEAPGRLDTSDVIEQILRARVVVCPSLIETFSRTTIEALALGRPVIVTNTTGAAHWVESTGCGSVVPPDNPRALARAIRYWMSRKTVPDASATITSELTAAHAAEDLIREVKAALHRPVSR